MDAVEPLGERRFFEARDAELAEPAALINEALAHKYFPARGPVVAGVVGNVERTTVYREMAWVDQPILYRAVSQNPGGSAHLILRLRPGAGAVGGAV